MTDPRPAIERIEDLEALRAGQLGRCSSLITLITRHGGARVSALREHFALLASLQGHDPASVAVILRHPQVNAWAAYTLRRLDAGGAALHPDLAYLGCVAAAAAIRARHPCTVRVPVRLGVVMLPSLGRARLGHGDSAVVEVTPTGAAITDGTTRVVVPDDPHQDAPGWWGLRKLSAGSVARFLEDLDPYRGYGRLALSDRADPATVAIWQTALTGAWRLLAAHHPRYAAALDMAWTSLVPLDLRPGEKHISADSADAFGAIAVSGPTDATTLAVSLVHEFQHAKLNALHELDPLFQSSGAERFYAPWRPDPRPVGGLLHGIYAHLGVADFWRVHRTVAARAERHLAEIEFARWLTQTLEAAHCLAGCDELTPLGAGFLADVTERLTSWLDEPVSDSARQVAEHTALDHRACWRLRNLRVDGDDIRRLAADWRARRVPTVRIRTRLEARGGIRNARPDLLYQRVRDPAGFVRDTAHRTGDPDVAYARDDYAAAAAGYRARLATDPEDRHAWTGLGLTSERAAVLARRPEVVYALHRELGHAPAPETLTEWLRDWDQVAGDSMLHSPWTPAMRPAITSG